MGGNLLPGEYNEGNLIKENDFLTQKYWKSFSECEAISLVRVVCLHYNESQHHYECDGPVSVSCPPDPAGPHQSGGWRDGGTRLSYPRSVLEDGR